MANRKPDNATWTTKHGRQDENDTTRTTRHGRQDTTQRGSPDIDGNKPVDNDNKKLIDEDDLADIREAFNLFDKDADGTIEKEELKKVLNDLGRSISDEELQDMIEDVDADGDGLIDFDEFCR